MTAMRRTYWASFSTSAAPKRTDTSCLGLWWFCRLVLPGFSLPWSSAPYSEPPIAPCCLLDRVSWVAALFVAVAWLARWDLRWNYPVGLDARACHRSRDFCNLERLSQLGWAWRGYQRWLPVNTRRRWSGPFEASFSLINQSLRARCSSWGLPGIWFYCGPSRAFASSRGYRGSLSLWSYCCEARA